MRNALVLSLILVSPLARAEDSWTGPDKVKHFALGAAVAAGGTAIAESQSLKLSTAKWVGFGLGCAAGVAKEAIDPVVSGKDIAITCLGAYLGAQGAGWVIERQRGTTVVAYRWEF